MISRALTRLLPSAPCQALTLKSSAGDFRAFKALIAAQYNGVKVVRAG